MLFPFAFANATWATTAAAVHRVGHVTIVTNAVTNAVVHATPYSITVRAIAVCDARPPVIYTCACTCMCACCANSVGRR